MSLAVYTERIAPRFHKKSKKESYQKKKFPPAMCLISFHSFGKFSTEQRQRMVAGNDRKTFVAAENFIKIASSYS